MYIKHQIEAILQVKADQIKLSNIYIPKVYPGNLNSVFKESVDSKVSKSMQSAPKEYEQLLRHYESQIRQNIEQLNHAELEI